MISFHLLKPISQVTTGFFYFLRSRVLVPKDATLFGTVRFRKRKLPNGVCGQLQLVERS